MSQETRPTEHLLVGVLHEILGVLVRPTEAVSGTVEPTDVRAELLGIELTRSAVLQATLATRLTHRRTARWAGLESLGYGGEGTLSALRTVARQDAAAQPGSQRSRRYS